MIMSLCVLCSCEGIIVSNGGFVFELTSDGNSYIVSKYKGMDTDVIIPSSYNELPVTIIGHEAFRGKKKIKNVEIPNSVTSIEYYAFEGCSSLTNIVIPESVTFIGECAFYGCKEFTKVVIPESVTSIGFFAFGNCSNLESVTIPFVGGSEPDGEKQTYFGFLFGSKSNTPTIKNGNLPESLKEVIITGGTSIERNAFALCEYIERIVIPSSVTVIDECAFTRCTSLTNIMIPKSVTNIRGSAFQECTSLTSVTFEEGSQLTNIERSAFRECASLTSIVIPENVSNIGAEAFSECASLTSIVIPENVSNIGSYTFYGCNNLIIYCEEAEQPNSWNYAWNLLSTYDHLYLPVYWAGEWEYDVNGNPIPLS